MNWKIENLTGKRGDVIAEINKLGNIPSHWQSAIMQDLKSGQPPEGFNGVQVDAHGHELNMTRPNPRFDPKAKAGEPNSDNEIITGGVSTLHLSVKLLKLAGN
jgi:hypothetical protein